MSKSNPYISIIRGGPVFSNMIAEELKKLGAKVDVCPRSYFFPLSNSVKLPKWDLIYLRIGGSIRVSFMLTSHLEMLGYSIVNNPKSIFRTNNKYLATVLLKDIVKTPKTYLIGKKIEDFNKLPKLLNFPFVLKPVQSIQGKGVEKIENQAELDKYVKKITTHELIGYPRFAQEYVNYDKLIRVVMVGNEIIDTAYDRPNKDWKCSVCQNPNVKPYPLDDKLKKIALQIKEITGQEICMLDIFENKGEYIFNEINNQCDLSFMQQATGVNHARKIARHLISQIN